MASIVGRQYMKEGEFVLILHKIQVLKIGHQAANFFEFQAFGKNILVFQEPLHQYVWLDLLLQVQDSWPYDTEH